MLTNLATEGFPWLLTAILATLVAAQVVLAVWQTRQDRRARRAARDDLLGPLRPRLLHHPAFAGVPHSALDDVVAGEATQVVHWLTAPFSPTRLWGRRTEHDRLVSWCVDRDPDTGVVRVVTGPAGVGKSRLALAVAESVCAEAPEWVAGWLQGSEELLVERIVVQVSMTDLFGVAGLELLTRVTLPGVYRGRIDSAAGDGHTGRRDRRVRQSDAGTIVS